MDLNRPNHPLIDDGMAATAWLLVAIAEYGKYELTGIQRGANSEPRTTTRVTIMFKRLVMITGLMLLASASWAQILDKSNSFSMEKDVNTGIWTYVCSVKIKGIDGQGFYNGTIRYISDFEGPTSILFVLGPNDRIYDESSPGVYEFQAKLTGKTFTIQLVYFVPQPSWTACAVSLSTGDIISIGDRLWGGSMELRYSGN